MGDWLNRQLGGATFTPASELVPVDRISPYGKDYLTDVGDVDKLEAIAAMYQDDYGPLDPTAEEEGLYSFEGSKIAKALKDISETAGKDALKPSIPKPISGDPASFARMPSGDVGYRVTQSPYEIPQEMLNVKDLRTLVNQLVKQQAQMSIVARPRQRLSSLI